MLKLAVMGAGLSGSLLARATVLSASGFSVADVTQMIIAITGLVAAVSAFVLGLRSRRDDPRDKLLEMLLEERKEAHEHEDDEPEPPPRRRRRHS